MTYNVPHTPLQYYTTRNHYRLAYHYSEGKLPLVVFLGGFMSDMEGSKALFLEELCRKEGRAFLRFDYMGHGKSEGKFTDGCISEWLANVQEMVQHINHYPVLLVGSSMGGWLALRFAQDTPEQVAGLIGIAAAPDFTENFMWQQFSEVQRAELQQQGRLFLPSKYGEDYPITHKLIEDGRSQSFFNRPAISYTMPVVLLQGMQDEDVPYAHAEQIAAHIGHGRVVVTLVKDGEHRLSRPQDLRLLQQAMEFCL